MPHSEDAGNVPKYDIAKDRYEGHVAVYLVAVERVVAEEGEGGVAGEAWKWKQKDIGLKKTYSVELVGIGFIKDGALA